MATFFPRFVKLLIIIFFYNISHSEKIFGQEIVRIHYQNPVTFKDKDLTSAKFKKAVFDSEANFSYSKFHCRANFSSAWFKSDAKFSGAEFDSVIFFSQVNFKHVDFDNAEFHSDVYFIGANFNRENNLSSIKFNSTEFDSRVYFELAILPDTLYFCNITQIKNEIDLTTTRLNSTKKQKNKKYKCQINLVGSNIGKIKINYDIFHLWFPDDVKYEERISTFEQLLKKFKDDGILESYKMLDIEYQEYKHKHIGDELLNWFLKHWWNYGYNKEMVLIWSLRFFFIFSLINILLFKYLQINVYEIKFPFYEKTDLPKSQLSHNFTSLASQQQYILIIKGALLKSWNYLSIYIINPMIYTAILFFGVKVSVENFKKYSGWVLYIWLIFIVGLFCLAYIVNIIIVK